MTATTTTSTSRKVLIPLATLLAAGAVAVGSGATWTSTTESSVDVTSGTLVHSNNHDGATLTLANIVPGDSMTGTVVVTNTGTVDSTLDFASSNVANTFSSDLTISVTADNDGAGPNPAVSLYSGAFAGLAASQSDVAFDEDDAITYTFVVTLEADAANVDQNKAASADFTWTQTQLDGESLTANWL